MITPNTFIRFSGPTPLAIPRFSSTGSAGVLLRQPECRSRAQDQVNDFNATSGGRTHISVPDHPTHDSRWTLRSRSCIFSGDGLRVCIQGNKRDEAHRKSVAMTGRVRFSDFQISARAAGLADGDPRALNIALFATFYPVHLWLRERRVTAPFQKLAVTLSDEVVSGSLARAMSVVASRNLRG